MGWNSPSVQSLQQPIFNGTTEALAPSAGTLTTSAPDTGGGNLNGWGTGGGNGGGSLNGWGAPIIQATPVTREPDAQRPSASGGAAPKTMTMKDNNGRIWTSQV